MILQCTQLKWSNKDSFVCKIINRSQGNILANVHCDQRLTFCRLQSFQPYLEGQLKKTFKKYMRGGSEITKGSKHPLPFLEVQVGQTIRHMGSDGRACRGPLCRSLPGCLHLVQEQTETDTVTQTQHLLAYSNLVRLHRNKLSRV